jgi:hypothetical protein
MHNDEVLVASEVNVKFKDVNAKAECLAEGFDGVFGNVRFTASVTGDAEFFCVLIPHNFLSARRIGRLSFLINSYAKKPHFRKNYGGMAFSIVLRIRNHFR